LNKPQPRTYFLFLVLTLLAFMPVLIAPFMNDDPFLITQNPRVQSWSLAHVTEDFTQPYYPDGSGAYYRPLQFIYLRSMVSVFGLLPEPFHLVNLLTQAANGWLLYALALSLGVPVGAALGAAALFVVHPIIAHEMLSASQTDIGAVFILLLAFRLLLSERVWARRIGVAVYVLGLLWKESLLVLPLLYAMTQYFRGRKTWADYQILIPLILFWGVYGVARTIAVPDTIGLHLESWHRFVLRILPGVGWHYLQISLWPWPLHSWPPLRAPGAWWPWNGLALVGVIGLLLWKGNTTVRWAVCWVLLSALPKIPAMMLNGVMMDHWLYAVLIGPFIALARLLPQNRGVLVLMLGVGLAWGVLAHENMAVRGSDEKNLRWTLRFDQPTFVEYRLAALLLKESRTQEALPLLQGLVHEFPNEPSFANAYAFAQRQATSSD